MDQECFRWLGYLSSGILVIFDKADVHYFQALKSAGRGVNLLALQVVQLFEIAVCMEIAVRYLFVGVGVVQHVPCRMHVCTGRAYSTNKTSILMHNPADRKGISHSTKP